MSFSQFTLKSVKERLGIQVVEDQQLFVDVTPEPVSDWLKKNLELLSPVALAVNTEKSRSEGIIAPILAEVREQRNRQISLFSGTSWSVDSQLGLEGISDFLICGTAELYYLTAPLMVVVEAKKEDIIGGLGPCLASMYAAKLFNQKENYDVPLQYGCVTSGENWKFLKLDGKIGYIDNDLYSFRFVDQIMGILLEITKPQAVTVAN
jgi:hypothetical protein